ncbi:hypothetical protein SUGI_1024740 [Cryptomeria japonica]|uniref:probable 2' cyclic ADP-D-ribose synthase BdTIR n=1 Tax=Cryptomeria japonica TaxID=3369 RepID=UPI002414A1D2|nr:probable 2' cyclic ADP-D-ribose synthase BdTIR [Cryptomeria japonica]GLJ48576.1 hypothetical protein SUGI_1024740 [Cryptomeria japonica]
MASSSSQQEIVEYDSFEGIAPAHQISRTPTSARLFDVFINHRGLDVKDTLALQLHKSLTDLGLKTFLDSEEMELGEAFPSTIHDAICSSLVHIAIFSKRYAESAWCLAELDLMVHTKCKIIPIFYDVSPLHLRYIETGGYADSFAKHKNKGRYLNKLEQWKKSLHTVSFIFGYEINKDNQ